MTFTESANDDHPDYDLTQVLYGFNKTASADLLAAIGLADGTGRYENADNTDKLDSANYYYTSNTLNKALADALAANSTTVKDALETYITANSGVEMTLTDANGSTSVSELPVGLYLLVETKVPEMVTSTVNPFFVSLPMTTVTGDENSASQDGGQRWNYDVVVYPKNETGIPTLEKTVRESAADTGKNSGTNGITDGYAHNATASTGDTLEYQIISSLPTITSKATALSVYNFYDSLSEGMEYSKEAGIKLEFFKDKDCTDSAASWDMESGKFTVTYSEDNRHMTVDITQAGLEEINGSASNANGAIYAGYSNYTLRITYTAEVNSDDSFVYGDNGNENEVVLTWKRTSGEHYDTLIDDAHVYSFAIDLTKVFTTEDPMPEGHPLRHLLWREIMNRKWKIGAACAGFLLALGITLYPLISTMYNNRHQSLIHTQYNQEIANANNQVIEENRSLAKQYNTTLVPGAQQVDAFSSAAVELASVDYANLLNIAGNGIMGYLVIPQIGAELPIYHGTSDATLEVGVGHLLGSSLPVGGASTHTVLTGHSGMANNKMLSDLDQLEIGDVFYLEVLEETLAYQVDQIKTVLPSDTTYLGIEEALDYCTLVTCTPFGVNTHRLLVRGSRIPYSKEEKELAVSLSADKPASTWEQQYLRGILLGIGITGILCSTGFLVTRLRKKGRVGKYER